MTELDFKRSRGQANSRTRQDLAGLTRAFLRDASGSTAIEYGLIMALVFLTIVTGMRYFADQTGAMYKYISAGLTKSS